MRRTAVFSAAVHVSALVHFVPSLVSFAENYGPTAYRVTAWNAWVHEWPVATSVPANAAAGIVAVLCGIVGAGGLFVRSTAVVGGLSWYYLACVNSLQTQTLALSALWASFWVLGLTGVEHGSPRSLAERKNVRLTGQLTSFYFLGTLFFSGVEKVVANWPVSDSMYRLAHYPAGGMLRGWVLGLSKAVTPSVGVFLEAVTLLMELLVPLLVLLPYTRRVATFAYVCFFVVVWSAFAIPPLFAILYLAAALLFKDLDPRLLWETVGSTRKAGVEQPRKSPIG